MSKGGNFYLRAPTLEYYLDGPIRIGNVIVDPKLPQDPITRLDFIPNIVVTSETKKETTVPAFARAFRREKSVAAYAFDEITTSYLATAAKSIVNDGLPWNDEEVQHALHRGPVSGVHCPRWYLR